MTIDILVVEDDAGARAMTAQALESGGHRVVTAKDGPDALGQLEQRRFDLVICDLRLPRLSGMEVFQHARERFPEIDFVLVTGMGKVDEAVQALKQGAADFLQKPFDLEALNDRVNVIAARRNVLRAAAPVDASDVGATALVGEAPAMVQLRRRISIVAPTASSVLITGESGTGKELVARMLHDQSARREKPFVAVNCAAFPETLLEAELFGHERGAFTGAVRRRDGRVKAADGGTLFLDEVGEMTPTAQAKLLRVLQEGTIEPLGTNESLHVDVRILAATHRNLRTLIAEGRFREDLFYRLNVLDIKIPPLRERRRDIPSLVNHFLRQVTPQGAKVPCIAPRAWAALSEYPYPGNVRELAHAVEHAAVLARGGEIDLTHLPGDIGRSAGGKEADVTASQGSMLPLAAAMKQFEREYVMRALAATNNQRTRAAELLGISRKNLWEKLKAWGVPAARDVEDETPPPGSPDHG